MMSAVLLVRTSLGSKPRFRELPQMSFTVYLSGEIHSDWRDEIKRGAAEAGLDVTFSAPVTDHPASDAAGDHLGETHSDYWGYRPKCVYGPGVSAASGPAFSGPKAFFGAEGGVVFRWAEGFFFHLRRGGGARVFELLLGGLPGVVGELSQSVQMPFDGSAGVVFVHSAVAA